MTKTYLITPRVAEAVLTAEHETFSAGRTNIENEISDRRNLEAAVETLPASERQAIRFPKVKMSMKKATAVSVLAIAALPGPEKPRKLLSGRSDSS